MNEYPENHLNIRIDENGKVTYEQDPLFAKYYFQPPENPAEARLEELRERLDDLLIREPVNLYSEAHDDWELRRAELEDEIADLESELGI